MDKFNKRFAKLTENYKTLSDIREDKKNGRDM